MRSSAAERLRASDGFTLVELLLAILVLGFAAMATAAVLTSSTQFANSSESRQSLANRAQREAERLSALPYDQLAHASLPASGSSSTSSPLYYFDPTAKTYRWDRTSAGASTAEGLVTNPAGTVVVQQSWSDGRTSGSIYDFVTWVTDGSCGAGCPTSQNYKRITVAVTASNGASVAPVYVSTVVVDPHAVPAGRVINGNANPLSDPTITCRDPSGTTTSCTASVGSSDVNAWYLSDTPATSTYSPPSASHPTQPTVAPFGVCTSLVNTGCPVPDLLSTTAPPAPTPLPPLLNYSTDQTGTTYPGGRIIDRDVSCSSTPSATDNTKGQEWATAPLSSSMILTGSGGMTINTQTANGISAGVTLCLGIYEAASIANLITLPPVRIGVVAYTVAQWPTTPTPISFSFDVLNGSTYTVGSGHRIIVRLWVAASSGADVDAIYDHPSYASVLQLNSE